MLFQSIVFFPSLLTWTWRLCYGVIYQYASTISLIHDKVSNTDHSFSGKYSRLLHERRNDSSERQLKYIDMQKRIQDLLDENNSDFTKRLKTSALDYRFVELFNVITPDDVLKKQYSCIMNDKSFQKHFNALMSKYNFENKSSNAFGDYKKGFQENLDPFGNYNNLEEFFRDLQNVRDNKAKLIPEFKHNMHSTEKLNDEFKSTIDSRKKTTYGSELSIALKLPKKKDFRKHPEKYMSKDLFERKDRSKLSKLPSTGEFELEMQRLRFTELSNYDEFLPQGRGIFNRLIKPIKKFGIYRTISLFPLSIFAMCTIISLLTSATTVLAPIFVGLILLILSARKKWN
ncbi:Plasmodium exported protein, unknown function [Plasmodium gonderi]|uniref:Pv-fam-d protein n=1 Tax=Plasmodium gonderi TaxID=77519 RepID=A0A1Y1J950_PLAGO|nr:Plasmodium exported protein, unknown function [Plasmodium gonderi]GAW79039.1 Plasmodium exported protein, unknown function [Plasmodium gonderi]